MLGEALVKHLKMLSSKNLRHLSKVSTFYASAGYLRFFNEEVSQVPTLRVLLQAPSFQMNKSSLFFRSKADKAEGVSKSAISHKAAMEMCQDVQ